MEHTWLIGLLSGFILLWGVSLIVMRHWTKRRLLRTLAQEGILSEDLEMQLPDPRPEDQVALARLRAYRREILLKIWPDTPFSFAALNDLSQEVLQEIAGIYYPTEERPELKASLTDLVSLFNRVGTRLRTWLETLPMRAVKDLELQTVLRYHEVYQGVKNHPGYLFLKRHHLDKVARWTWAAKNWASPWYWGRQLAYTGSKEILARLFMARVAAIVGEEAIRLYSRRSPNARMLERYRVAVQEMINLALENGEVPARSANFILRFILQARGLEDQEKLALLNRLAQPRRRDNLRVETLAPPEQEQLHRWLNQLAATRREGLREDREDPKGDY